MREKENNFLLLRLIAAFLVFAGHLYILTGYVPPTILWHDIQKIGTATLFLAGGYSITLSWENDSNILHYAIKRILRILPPLAVCVLLSALVVGPLTTFLSPAEYFAHPQFKEYFGNLIFKVRYFLPGAFSENTVVPDTVNGSLWSMPAEVFMYMVIPVLYIIGKLTKKPKVVFMVGTIISIIAASIRREYYPAARLVFYDSDFAQIIDDVIPYYLIGGTVAVWKPDRKIFNVKYALICVGLIHCLGFYNRLISTPLYMLTIAYAILSLAFTPEVKAVRKWKIYYGVYLYGFVVVQCVIYTLNCLGYPQAPMVVMVIGLAITVLMAWLSQKIVEDPFNKLAKKLCKMI